MKEGNTFKKNFEDMLLKVVNKNILIEESKFSFKEAYVKGDKLFDNILKHTWTTRERSMHP